MTTTWSAQAFAPCWAPSPECASPPEASDGVELLALLESVHPDIVITDISMPGMDGIPALAEIKARHPAVKVIVLSIHDSADAVKRAIACGAAACLRKDASEFELGSALHAVMTTGSYISAGIARLLMEPAQPTAEELLTPRQIEILKLLVRGKASKEIAFALGLSSKTVDVHRARITDRLNVRDVANLTLYAVRNGLLDPDSPVKAGGTPAPALQGRHPGASSRIGRSRQEYREFGTCLARRVH